MSSAPADGFISEVNDVGAENVVAGDVATLDRELGLLEPESKTWREELDKQRAALGDAEEICVFLLDDLLLAMFQEMQVQVENASLFALVTRQVCSQVFESVDMSGSQPSHSLDQILGIAQYERSSRQQVLETQHKWAQSQHRSATSDLVRAVNLSPPPILFLRRLVRFFEMKPSRVKLELQRFHSSVAVSSLSGKHQLVSNESVKGSGGHSHDEWCISTDHVEAFLQGLSSKGLVSILPSAIAYVLAANCKSFDTNEEHCKMYVSLPQLQHYVKIALLTAEEDEDIRQHLCSSMNDSATESTPRSRFFYTEVPQCAIPFAASGSGDVRSIKLNEGPGVKLLSSYLAEAPPRAVEVDSRAPGQICKKATLGTANASRRALSRKIAMLLAPSPRQGSRWTSLRNKLIVPSLSTPTAEVDVKPRSRPSVSLNSVPGKRASVAGAGAIASIDYTTDTASLSNIFALGTPRQLSAQELARRNDLLAQIERETARAQRRASTTGIASMGIDGSLPINDSASPTQAHREFQAYVAANSIIMNGLEPDGHPATLSPTRPERGSQASAPRRRGGGAPVARSKFEQERDFLPYSVSDGNAHGREEQDQLTAAVCSPIKRPRGSVSLSPPLETPGRPVRSPSMLANLPQLDSSRLAVGVSAVVRGVEKYGPRRNPSRNSRLQLHNYSKAFDEAGSPEVSKINGGASMPFSPVRTGGKEESSTDYRLPLIPVVSPIKASPHHRHVAFKPHDDGVHTPQPTLPKAHTQEQSPTKTKQRVWETKTISPPRSRNRHFASGRHFHKMQVQRYASDDDVGDPTRPKCQKQDDHANIFRQPMAAPRRAVLSDSRELDDES